MYKRQIHNAGNEKSEHDGVHRFFVGKNAHVKYVEKHYGEGDGGGERVLNPTTILELEENAVCELEMVQIKGVDSTVRETTANLARGAKIIVTERLMTHGHQMARSDMEVNLNGEGSSAQIVSRSVGRDESQQIFNPRAVGNDACAAHIQCDSIIMDAAHIRSIPEIDAKHAQAQIIHEAVSYTHLLMNYDIMRESMLQGFNTYDTYSVLSHVLLPEGFAIKLGLKHRVEKTVLRNALIGRFGEQEEHIHPGVRTVDGSYTQLELEYRGARLDVRSSAAGREQYLLIEPKNEKCRELILFMKCGFLWNKPGAAYVREDCVEGVTDSGSIRVYTVSYTHLDVYKRQRRDDGH